MKIGARPAELILRIIIASPSGHSGKTVISKIPGSEKKGGMRIPPWIYHS